MFLLEVHNGLFADTFQLAPAQHTGWRLITPCTENLPPTDPMGNSLDYRLQEIAAVCPFLYETSEFTDPQYVVFTSLLQKMLKFASGGHIWKDMGDEVHDGGDVIITRVSGKPQTHSIIQFGKKRTLVRIHAFTNGTGRKIAFISHSFVKPANSKKTPASEQKRSRNNLNAFFQSLDEGTAQLIDIQGGRNGFLNLV